MGLGIGLGTPLIRNNLRAKVQSGYDRSPFPSTPGGVTARSVGGPGAVAGDVRARVSR